MKAQDLRIGNLLKEGKVKSIYLGNHVGIDDGFSRHIDILSPIELTEEWLMRFGLNKTHNSYFIDYFLIEQNDGQFEYPFENYQIPKPSVIIRFVHQLQNLYFALTGSELELKSLPETTTK